jgi:hypothetical protein
MSMRRSHEATEYLAPTPDPKAGAGESVERPHAVEGAPAHLASSDQLEHRLGLDARHAHLLLGTAEHLPWYEPGVRLASDPERQLGAFIPRVRPSWRMAGVSASSASSAHGTVASGDHSTGVLHQSPERHRRCQD